VKGHRFDPASFIFGVAFVALAAASMFTNYHLGSHWLSWAGAALLIVAGLAMVTGSRSRLRARDEDR